MVESEGELKSLLMSVTEESEKVGLKVNIKTTKTMVPILITSWKIEKKLKQWQILFCQDLKSLWQLPGDGAAVKRYPKSKVRETPARQ